MLQLSWNSFPSQTEEGKETKKVNEKRGERGMEKLIIEIGKPVKSARSGASQTGEDNDREMHECLARLKVWRVENLMSSTGMDRFAGYRDAGGPKNF